MKFVSAENILISDNPREDAEAYSSMVASLYKASGEQIATAESCTGGLLAKLLTDISGSSAYYECGVVSYSERIKIECLHLNPDTIKQYGVVSAAVATEMAQRVKSIANSSVAIGITGVAGPGSSDGKPEGEIYIALATKYDTYIVPLQTNTTGAREYNRYTAALNALNLLLLHASGKLQ